MVTSEDFSIFVFAIKFTIFVKVSIIFSIALSLQVTDYTRDLEEMQNVSREEYLASLRRFGSKNISQSGSWHISYSGFSLAGRAVASLEECLNIVRSPGMFTFICYLYASYKYFRVS